MLREDSVIFARFNKHKSLLVSVTD
jgi:hypothetical protein